MSKIENNTSWKDQLHEIIYEADTKAGKIFDVVLLITILASVLFVMLESVESFDKKYHTFLNVENGLLLSYFL